MSTLDISRRLPKRRLHVLVVCDVAQPVPADQDFRREFTRPISPSWESEFDVVSALERLGHKVHLVGVFNELSKLDELIASQKVDVIFNLAEALAGDRSAEGLLAQYLRQLGIAVTGVSRAGLEACKDKAMSKYRVAKVGGRVPEFEVLSRNSMAAPTDRSKWTIYPAIVKPLNLEASAGISEASYVRTEGELLLRAQYIHRHFNCDAIVERFVDGREFYVGTIAEHGRLSALPPREFFFGRGMAGRKRIATAHLKWNDQNRLRRGAHSKNAASLPASVSRALQFEALRAARALDCDHPGAYARFDFRLDRDGYPVFIEANANPSIARADDFAQAARTMGLSYCHLISLLIQTALKHSAESKTGKSKRIYGSL